MSQNNKCKICERVFEWFWFYNDICKTCHIKLNGLESDVEFIHTGELKQ